MEKEHFRNAQTLLLLRRRAAPEQPPHCVNATTFLCVFLLLKLGEGERSSIVARPVCETTHKLEQDNIQVGANLSVMAAFLNLRSVELFWLG